MGVLLIGIGVIWIGIAFQWLPPVWTVLNFIIRYGRILWPLALVALGIVLLTGRGGSRSGPWLLAALVIIGLLVVLPLSPFMAAPWFDGFGRDQPLESVELDIPMEQNIASGRLVLDAGAASFSIVGATQNSLMTGSITGGPARPQVSWSRRGESGEIAEVFIDVTLGAFKSGGSRSDSTLALNDAIPWDLVFDLGASRAELDLRRLTIRGLDLDVGAAGVDAYFGDFIDGAQINLDAGAGAINLTLPRHVGAQLSLSAGLGRQELTQFTLLSDGLYQSTNWDSASTRIFIDVDSGIHSLNIRWSKDKIPQGEDT